MASSIDLPNRHSRERRNFPRVLYRTTAEIEAAGGRWPVQLVDLSFSGALVVSTNTCPLDVSDELILHVNLHEEGRIKMRGHLAHVQGSYLGIECTPAGIDHRAKLRRLIKTFNRAG
ncbi:PilZ domain-containing protein [Halioxenophilus sp. WMMB6]|uniref:PilZ domain-containing protein n=1 Tax=Halioxenophilus sp. WMMB6 TaxID=3073815 RepID=UPI00295F2501|nr:PilZ domain-containing protein [Halioxenophilus sp. WMMB6]